MRIDGGDSKDTIYVSIDEHTETEDLYCNKRSRSQKGILRRV